MNCVRPPLLKKPSRGFAWSCAACSRAQERKLEAQHIPGELADLDDDEQLDEEEEDVNASGTTHDDDEQKHHQGTAEQIYQASLWPWRYLGMHCKPEDALDYDDRIYPRASTRIGPRNQAAVQPWPGRPVEYEKPLEIKKVGKKDAKAFKEAQAAIEAAKSRRENRPKWVQDAPADYHVRGLDYEDDNEDGSKDREPTSTRLWIPPAADVPSQKETEAYMKKAIDMAEELDLPILSTNLHDVALNKYYASDYNPTVAISILEAADPSTDFGEPRPTPEDDKLFAEAVSKYGNELGHVTRYVKNMHYGDVVRYYYTWKKTKGKEIWSNFSGRKGKKEAKKAEANASKMADDVADDDDDSAFDSTKASQKKRNFMCQFCGKTQDRQWRRAPNAAPISETAAKNNAKDKNAQYVGALCRRCAELWRRYAIVYEPVDEVLKKITAAGGRGWRRKQDDELLRELQAAQDWGLITPERQISPIGGAAVAAAQEPPRKKLKSDKDVDASVSDGGGPSKKKEDEKKKEKEKEKEKEKASATPPVPEMPKPRVLPCGVCGQLEPQGDQHISCRECRLTVHRNCYGVTDSRPSGKWVCDMCLNDKNPQVSIHYKCVLCPVEYTQQELVEPPKVSHHKKRTEKDKEREKMESQQVRKAAEQYRKKQEDMGRPTMPREPLKRTADNNWVHVTCAVWTPEVKFGNAKAMEPSEGIPSIPGSRYEGECEVCHHIGGAVAYCQNTACRLPFHIECARQAGHVLAFTITAAKGSRKDRPVVTINGESGTMSAHLWCQDHLPSKTGLHQMWDIVDESGLNALQLYVQNSKQADLALTGTVRKANLMNPLNFSKTSGAPPVQAIARRLSTTTTTTIPNGSTAHQGQNGDVQEIEIDDIQRPGDKVCVTCGIDVSPKWWSVEQNLMNGHHDQIGAEAQKFVEQRKFQCHKCHKTNRTPKPYQTHPAMPTRSTPEPTQPQPVAYEAARDASDFATQQNSPEMRNGNYAAYTSRSPRLSNGLQAPPPAPRDYGHPPHQHHPGRDPNHVPMGYTPARPPPEGAWPQPAHHAVGHHPPPGGHHHAQPRTAGSPPPPPPGHYPPPGPPPPVGPPHAAYHWQGPPNHHGSPPHQYVGHAPIASGPPPSHMTSLRPPTVAGSPPGPPGPPGPPAPAGQPNGHRGAPPAVNGMSPPLPARARPPPGHPPPYSGPYQGSPGHGPPPPHPPGPMRGYQIGPVPPPPARQEAYPSPGSIHRPYPPPQGSPPVRRVGPPPPPHEHHGSQPPPSAPPRLPEAQRPNSGASANPSLRNLLS